jgi:hypothetical protein
VITVRKLRGLYREDKGLNENFYATE